MHEQIGGRSPECLVHPEPAPFLVDAPALPARVGGPRDRDVPSLVRGRHKTAGDGFAPPPILQALEDDPVVHTSAPREMPEHCPRCPPRRAPGDGALDAFREGKRLPRRVLDEEPRGPIGATPDDGPPLGDVPRGDAVGYLRAGAVPGDGGWSLRPLSPIPARLGTSNRREHRAERDHRLGQEGPPSELRRHLQGSDRRLAPRHPVDRASQRVAGPSRVCCRKRLVTRASAEIDVARAFGLATRTSPRGLHHEGATGSVNPSALRGQNWYLIPNCTMRPSPALRICPNVAVPI